MMDSEFNAVAHFILRPLRKSAPDPAYREAFERLVRALNMQFNRYDYAEMLRRGMVAMFEPEAINTTVHIRELSVPSLTQSKRKRPRLKGRERQLLLPSPKAAPQAVAASAASPTKKKRRKSNETSRLR
jgi:hypothetical protein